MNCEAQMIVKYKPKFNDCYSIIQRSLAKNTLRALAQAIIITFTSKLTSFHITLNKSGCSNGVGKMRDDT